MDMVANMMIMVKEDMIIKKVNYFMFICICFVKNMLCIYIMIGYGGWDKGYDDKKGGYKDDNDKGGYVGKGGYGGYGGYDDKKG